MLPPPIDTRTQSGNLWQAAPHPAVVSPYAVPEFDHKSSEPAGMQTLTAYLWRRKWAIVAAAICGLLAGVTVGLFSRPVYRAHTSLKLEGFNDQKFTLVSPLSASPQDYLQNEVKVLESDTLARRVASQLGKQVGPMIGDQPSPLQNAWRFLFPPQAADPVNSPDLDMGRIEKALTVRTGLQSQVIDIFFDALDPVVAARGANAVASEFINLNREARGRLVQDTTEWLKQQAATLKAKRNSLNLQLQDFTARSGLVLPGREGTPAQDRLRQLQDALTHAEADRAAKQGRYEAAAVSPGEITPDATAPSTLKQYEVDLQNMRRQLADLRTLYTPDNYRITRLTAQISETEGAIERERKQTLERMRNDYLAAASLERTLSLSLAGQLATVQEQTEKGLEFNVIQNELNSIQKLYDSALEREKDAGAASSLRITNVRVIDKATPPPSPYSPNLHLNMAIGLGIGTLGGAGLVLLGSRSGKVKQPGELASIYIPELGVVPSASKRLVIANRDRSIPDKFDSTLLLESFRAILTSMFFRTPEHDAKHDTGLQPGRVFAVTSVDMMEGKTTIVTNLGIACALQKRDVLLIDADLRRPRLHKQFGLSNTSGLTTLLQLPYLRLLDCALPDFVQPTKFSHLWVLTSGPTDATTANLLHAGDLDALLRSFALRFGLILIDTPPMSIYPDARVLGRMSDGAVMVVRANTKSRQELRAAYQSLSQDGIRVAGTILNDWKIDRDQARAYARYYRHYQQQNDDTVKGLRGERGWLG
jgi:polysaccharide biosynthesis transport protein